MLDERYQAWQPLWLERATLETLNGDAYRRFIDSAVLEPGCLLLLERHRRHPEWPYVETKFNPNTGNELGPEAYRVVYAWLLGRGSEALGEHLRHLDRVLSRTPDERMHVREVFTRWIASMTRTIAALVEANQGRLPFRVNREGVAVDERGLPVPVDAGCVGAGDVFGLKGLLYSADPALHARSRAMLQRAATLVRQDRVENEQRGASAGRGQGMRMLMQGVGMCAARRAAPAEVREEALAAAAACLAESLDTFYEPETATFSEYVDPQTGARSTYLDPGHANELAGLGLGMIEALAQSRLAGQHAELIARARRELPRLLLKSSALGFNPKIPGLYKAVDNRSGAPINTDMPWWNLPETMRAAVRACVVVKTEAERAACMDLYARCHNAYFGRYLSRANMLFPVQTIDGRTGRVADVVPAIPEGDPLYHANGAFLDMLEVLDRL